MPPIQKIRDLLLSAPSQPGRPAFISAASGLVSFKDRLYVIADDELALGVFGLESEAPGVLHRLLPGALPLDPRSRKKEKPDFESLVLVHPMLLAVPSGSEKNRMTGVGVPLGPDGSPLEPAQSVRAVDFTPLYEDLSRHFAELNIEGAVVVGGSLKLFQRGNGPSGRNAVIELDLPGVLEGLSRGKLPSRLLRAVTSYDLGELRGTKLSFTDATALEDGSLLFVAAAEDSGDTYSDAPCEGSVLGIIDRAGRLVSQEEITPRMKAEGVCVGPGGQVLIVTDGDDPEEAAGLWGVGK